MGAVALGPEIFGTPLPHTTLAWVSLLIFIWGALLTVLGAVEKFVERNSGKRGVLRPYGGLALPLGWAVWCVALLVAQRDPVAVLIVLTGTLIITAAGQTLVRKCRE